jgi:AAA family ATP:ADP antiporter
MVHAPVVDVRRDELGRTGLSFCILLLVVGSYTIVKAVRDAVFLSRFGITELSLVAIGLAVLAGVIVARYQRATAGKPRHWVITVTHTIIAASLVGLWWAMRGQGVSDAVAWTLYVWSALFGVFIVRLFGVIGAGAIIGGLSGGLAAQWLAPVLGTPGLLLLAAGMLMLAAALSHAAWPMRLSEATAPRTKREAGKGQNGIIDLVRRPSFVRLIALGLLLSTMVTTLIDWQFKAVAKHTFAGRTDAMAAFFGSLFAYQSAASLVFQVFATGWLLRRFGVGVGRQVLPVALVLGSVAILGHGALPIGLLAAAAGAKVAEGGLRFAIDKATQELTWLPVPKDDRDRSKSLVDTVVDRLGTGVTGIAWLGLAAIGWDRPDKVHLVSVLALLLLVLWLAVLRTTQRAYVNAFREGLASRAIDLESLRMALGDAAAMRTITETLESEDGGKVRFGLYLLERCEQKLPDLSATIGHPDSDVKVQALRLATEHHDDRYEELAEKLLNHTDGEVRETAIVYLRRALGRASIMEHEVADEASIDDAMGFSRALIALDDPKESKPASRAISQSLRQDDEGRIERIRMLGAAPPSAAADLLRPLLSDDDEQVVEAALYAAGRAKAVALATELADLLGAQRWRARALTALTDIGAAAIERLVDRLQDQSAPLEARRAIVWLAGASRSPAMGPPLETMLGNDVPELARAATRAIARLNAQAPVRVDGKRTERLLLDELDELYRELLLLGRGGWPHARRATEDEDFFERALRESSNARVNRLFFLLSLLYPPEDTRNAHRGLSSPVKATRSKSLEFLDNVLTADLRARMLPALDEIAHPQLSAAARRVAAIAPESLTEALVRMLEGSDRWLRAVACWKIGVDRIAALRGDLERLDAGSDHELAPVLQRALRQLDTPEEKDPAVGLTLVEKALKLRTVDVLEQASSEDLAYVAQIAEEVELGPESTIYADGDAPDALYVVLDGEVELKQGEVEIGVIGAGEAFGSWALVDDAPRVASAHTKSAATLLKVDREEFIDLLSDRAGIVQALFKAMVGRIRALADLAKGA